MWALSLLAPAFLFCWMYRKEAQRRVIQDAALLAADQKAALDISISLTESSDAIQAAIRESIQALTLAQHNANELLKPFISEHSTALQSRMDEIDSGFKELSTRVAVGAGRRVLRLP